MAGRDHPPEQRAGPELGIAEARMQHREGAHEVWVSVRATAAEIRMQIVDRGVGFDTQCAVPSGVGLVAIRERLKLVNGDSAIVSRQHLHHCESA